MAEFAATAIEVSSYLQKINKLVNEGNLIAKYDLPVIAYDIDILLALLSESAAKIQSAPSQPSRSATLVFKRCLVLVKQLASSVEILKKSKFRIEKDMTNVNQFSVSFKSMVLLLHSIASR